jgi:hypothetical protein
MEVVEVEKGSKPTPAFVGVVVGEAVRPFAEQSLDHTFDFSVGLRAVGSGANMAQGSALTGVPKGAGSKGGAIVGHDGFYGHATIREPAHGMLKERNGTFTPFVGEQLGEGKA